MSPTPGIRLRTSLDPERGVVAQEQAVVAAVGRHERDDEDDGRRLLLGDDPLPLHFLPATAARPAFRV